MTDKINPEHYKRGGLETIEILEKKLTKEEFIGAMKANQQKYLDRRGYKEIENLSEIELLYQNIIECDKQSWYTEKEKQSYLKSISEVEARIKSDEWIDDPLHDED